MSDLRCAVGLVVIVAPVLAIFLFYDYGEKIKNYDQTTARKLFARNLAWSFVFLAGIVIFFLLPASVHTGIWIVLLLMVWLLIGKFLWSKYTAGEKLIELERDHRQTTFILSGILFVIFTLPEITDIKFSNTDLLETINIVTKLSLAILLLLQGIIRNEFTDEGLRYHIRLIRWENIQRHQWVGKDENTLVLQTAAPLALLQKTMVTVSSKQKEAVRNLMRECR